METIPLALSTAFVLVTAATVYLFYRASGESKISLLLLLAWLLVQFVLTSTGFYENTTSLPPRLGFALVPTVLLIAVLFLTKKGKQYSDSLDLKTLTLLHVVRIPVELVLWGLFIYNAVPEIMTFEGRNLDVLSGISAPLLWYFGFANGQPRRKLLLAWNIACLALLVNIVTIAILAAPYSFQQLAFDQPNIGVLLFPFIWLPACVVPLVLFSHLVAIRRLW